MGRQAGWQAGRQQSQAHFARTVKPCATANVAECLCYTNIADREGENCARRIVSLVDAPLSVLRAHLTHDSLDIRSRGEYFRGLCAIISPPPSTFSSPSFSRTDSRPQIGRVHAHSDVIPGRRRRLRPPVQRLLRQSSHMYQRGESSGCQHLTHRTPSHVVRPHHTHMASSRFPSPSFSPPYECYARSFVR